VDANRIQVSFQTGDAACVITVNGELTRVTEGEFTARAGALAALPAPVIFDLSGVDFVDCSGARALARAFRAGPPRETWLRGCSPAVARIFAALGLDLPPAAAPARAVPARERPLDQAGPRLRGDDPVALARAAQADARQSAMHASEVMSRLAATYAQLALSGRYRAQRKSEERRRLLALSGHARELSRQYMRHATGSAD